MAQARNRKQSYLRCEEGSAGQAEEALRLDSGEAQVVQTTGKLAGFKLAMAG